MPLDGISLGFLARELSRELVNGRIDRVVQPEKDELHLTIRNNGKNHLLMLGASAGNARAQLITKKKTGPLEPPSLCMLMRKHITGGRVVSIEQKHCDRILEIGIEHYDELGDKTEKKLICEFMGKHSNIIFVGADGRIIDCARHVTEAISSVREVLPGLRYEDPPAHGKIDYDSVTEDALLSVFSIENGELRKVLARNISGLSQQAAGELAFRAVGRIDAHLEECSPAAAARSVAETLRRLPDEFSPRVLYDPDGGCADFAAFEYKSRAMLRQEPCGSLSEAMERFYETRDRAERISQKSASLHQVLKTNIERCERKLALQREALLGSARMEEYRLKGELLQANLRLAVKGQKKCEVPNYYEEGIPTLTVELDEKLSPAQNAQRYFKLYQKARNAQTLAAEQIEKTTEELTYLEGQADNLTKCTEENELSELRDELEKLGYVKANRNRRQIKQLPPSAPMKFTLENGRVILIGKNNLQNDKLTFSAQPDEIWLHAKDMPGSHVIIVGEDPDDATILAAAKLAAKYSKGGASSQVPVDYTRRRYVKKPSGAKPGFVIYTHQHTLYVTPE